MATSLILTVIGTDKPGVVDALSTTLAAQQANWLESRIASLAGRFVGILLASVPEANVVALKDALHALESEALRITVEASDSGTTLQESRAVKLELVGQDRVGIVRDISHALAQRGVSIEELATEILSASWSGETLVKATADLRVPRELPTADLRAVLEDIANELMVDVTLDDVPSTSSAK